jgi:hypothetical protein
MNPTDDDLSRCAAADLAVCEAASPGPWTARMARIEDDDPDHYCGLVRGQGYRTPAHCYGGGPKRRLDCEFIAMSRTALPAWIRRAQAAEAEVARLRHVIAGHEKAAALMNAGMESQCSLMDAMKQELREAQDEVARLRAEREAVVEHIREGGDL